MTSAAVGPLCNPCNNPQQHQGHPSFAAPRQPLLHPPSHSSHSHPLFQALWEGHTGSQAVQPSSALGLGPGGENEGIEGGQGSFSATQPGAEGLLTSSSASWDRAQSLPPKTLSNPSLLLLLQPPL